nr:hypothetical protein [Paludibacterium denitrificans]
MLNSPSSWLTGVVILANGLALSTLEVSFLTAVGVDRRGLRVFVTHQLLALEQVNITFSQFGAIQVAQGMWV